MSSAIFVFVNTDGQVLMEQRSDDDSWYPGEWLFPGGKLEEGESPEDAFFREVAEELGVIPTHYHPLTSTDKRYSRPERKDHEIYPFICTEWLGKIPTRVYDSGNKLSWVTLDSVEETSVRFVADLALDVREALDTNPPTMVG